MADFGFELSKDNMPKFAKLLPVASVSLVIMASNLLAMASNLGVTSHVLTHHLIAIFHPTVDGMR